MGDATGDDATARPAAAQRQSFLVRSSDGTLLAAESQGDPAASEIVFIHGMRQSRMIWDRQFADPALAGFHLVRFDLRGHGDSDKPDLAGAYADLDRWADDLAAVIEAAKLRRPVLVGWSLGALVVGGYLLRHGGGGIAGLALVGPVTKMSPELLTPLSAELRMRTASHDLAERSCSTAAFLRACFETLPAEAELEQMMVVNGMVPRAVGEGMALPGKPDLDPAFRAFSGPILLVHGVRDQLVRVEMSRRIAAMRPDSRLSLYEESGHSPFYENAPRFDRELAAFVTDAAAMPGKAGVSNGTP